MYKKSVTKIFNFETGHRLSDYEGKCKNIHGHSYRLEVKIKGEINNQGMIIDFGTLKAIVNKIIDANFDHKIILKEDSRFNKKLKAVLSKDSMYLVNYNPTAENMVIDFYTRIGKELPKGLAIDRIRLYETATSYADLQC